MAVLVSGVGAAALVATSPGFDLGTPKTDKEKVAELVARVKKLAANNPAAAEKINRGIADYNSRNPKGNNVAGAQGLLDWAKGVIADVKAVPAAATVIVPGTPTVTAAPPPPAAAPAVTNSTPIVSPQPVVNGTVISRPQLILYPGDIVKRQPAGSIRGSNFRDVVFLDEDQRPATGYYRLTWRDENGLHTKDMKPGDLIPYGFTVEAVPFTPAPTASTATIVPTGGASGGSGGASLLTAVASALGLNSAASPASAALAGSGGVDLPATTGGGIAPPQPPVVPGTPANSGGAGSATTPDAVASPLSNPYVIAGGVGVVALVALGILMLPPAGGGR